MERSLEGRVALVTGASSGIGRETARSLASLGARVVLLTREDQAGRAVAEELRTATGNPAIESIAADLSSLAEVRRAAAQFAERSDRLNILVNNAGLAMHERLLTIDGLETTFAVNHLAPVLLTLSLLDRLKAGAPARVVGLSSSGHSFGRINWDDLGLERNWSGLKAYSQSKLAVILFTRELARRLSRSGVSANAVHPGVIGTAMNYHPRTIRMFKVGYKLVGRFMKKPADGARPVVRLAASPAVEGVTGQYFDGERLARPSKAARDDESARRLWEESLRLVGLRDPTL